jgi:hypothetical protein
MAEEDIQIFINNLYQNTLAKNDILQSKINNIYKKVLTDKRNAYYTDKQLENIRAYYKYILIVYYTLIVLYILFGSFFDNNNYKSILIWILMIIYVSFPFLLNYLLTILFNYMYVRDMNMPWDNNNVDNREYSFSNGN